MDGLIDFLAWCVNEEVHTEVENEQENNGESTECSFACDGGSTECTSACDEERFIAPEELAKRL